MITLSSKMFYQRFTLWYSFYRYYLLRRLLNIFFYSKIIRIKNAPVIFFFSHGSAISSDASTRIVRHVFAAYTVTKAIKEALNRRVASRRHREHNYTENNVSGAIATDGERGTPTTRGLSFREEVRRADSADSVYVTDERWFREEREGERGRTKEAVEESLTWMGCGNDGRQGWRKTATRVPREYFTRHFHSYTFSLSSGCPKLIDGNPFIALL